MTKIELPIDDFKAIVQYKNYPIYFFRFNSETTENNTIVCDETTVVIKNISYDVMVDALIDTKYTIPAQLALLYNYQSDPEKYIQEMEEYQQWRNYCKTSAKKFFNIQ